MALKYKKSLENEIKKIAKLLSSMIRDTNKLIKFKVKTNEKAKRR